MSRTGSERLDLEQGLENLRSAVAYDVVESPGRTHVMQSFVMKSQQVCLLVGMTVNHNCTGPLSSRVDGSMYMHERYHITNHAGKMLWPPAYSLAGIGGYMI